LLLNRALQLRPGYIEVLNNIGVRAFLFVALLSIHSKTKVVLQEKQLYGGAAKYYKLALQLRPSYHGALTNLGDVLKDSGLPPLSFAAALTEACLCQASRVKLSHSFKKSWVCRLWEKGSLV
jgi:hypothetical protein